jgi:hypothetical protein
LQHQDDVDLRQQITRESNQRWLEDQKIEGEDDQDAKSGRETHNLAGGSDELCGCDREIFCCFITYRRDWTRLAVLIARIELPGSLVPTRKAYINDVRNDDWDFRKATLFAVQEEVLVLTTHDEGWNSSQVSVEFEVCLTRDLLEDITLLL